MNSTSSIRGIEHVGITVPDIEQATEFFVRAFDAEPIYDFPASPQPRLGGSGSSDSNLTDQATLGVRPGVRWVTSRMLRLGNGPNIELFCFDDPDSREAATASDFGLQHLGLFVDDMDQAREQVVAAGGRALAGPSILSGPEGGEGNAWLYTLAPWGSIIELICLPSPQAYEQTTSLRRWRPEPLVEQHPGASSAKEEG